MLQVNLPISLNFLHLHITFTFIIHVSAYMPTYRHTYTYITTTRTTLSVALTHRCPETDSWSQSLSVSPVSAI